MASDIPFPGPEAYPKWLVPIAIGCGVPFLLWFRFGAGNPLKGFVAALSAASVVVVFVTLRQLRRYFSFWLAISADILFHCWLVSALWGSDSHFPGVIFTPLVVADFLLWQWIVVTSIRTLKF